MLGPRVVGDRLARLVPGSVVAAYRKDPALHGAAVVEILLYPGLWAIAVHRVAHALWALGVPFLPRLLSQAVRLATAIEIHPGATLGKRLFIDHGAGVVIGETAEVGDDVMLYHGVTLGGHGWWADDKGTKRHPTVGHDVTLGVGASVLGPVRVGDGSRIGPHAVVIDDVPPRSIVVAPKGRRIVERGIRRDTRVRDDVFEPGWLEPREMGGL